MRRHGITLVELLVCVGVVTIIIAIALPAVQSVRESARRVQCQNNIRQILLATHAHHAAQNALPSFYSGTTLPFPLRWWDRYHMHSWRVPLLPYLEQPTLRQQLKWDFLATAIENEFVAQTVVPVFICPSGGSTEEMGFVCKHDRVWLQTGPNTPERDRCYVARSDYDALLGVELLPRSEPGTINVDSLEWGIWGRPVFDGEIINSSMLGYRQGKFRDVQDGLSNTLAVVERAGKPIEWLNGKPNRTVDFPNADYPGQPGWSASSDLRWSINANRIGINQSNSEGMYSFHRDGTNVGVTDGSVRLLSDSTDFETLVVLIGRSNGVTTE